MRARIVSLVTPLVVGIMALALGWFAHAAAPLAAQGTGVDGHAALSDPAAPAVPAGTLSRLTYQGRLTDKNSGAPINAPVNVTFRLYDSVTAPVAIYTATHTITTTNGLFTVYLGDGDDPDLAAITLVKAAFIGVQVGGDANEMSPRQALNTVVGHSDNQAGVVGSSVTGIGVAGWTGSGVGVLGASTVVTGAGVVGEGSGTSGIALELSQGGIKVTGAGIGQNTPAFVYVTSAGTITATNQTIISHPLTDSRPDAILIVTPVNNYANAAGVNNPHPVGVFWRNDLNKWVIYNIDGVAMPVNTRFNVLVVNP